MPLDMVDLTCDSDSDNDVATDPKMRDELSVVEEKLGKIRTQIVQLKVEEFDLLQYKRELEEAIIDAERSAAIRPMSAQQQQKASDPVPLESWSVADPDSFPWTEELDRIREKTFGMASFRSVQRGVMNATISGQDCFLIMPTGGGKSLCYQLPALIGNGVTLVISPLLSLIHDQCMQLNQLGLKTSALTSNSSKEEQSSIYACLDAGGGGLKFLYVTPEKVAQSKRFLGKLEKLYHNKGLDRIAIDEAHCCSQWGHDFRPVCGSRDYKQLSVLRRQFPKTPILALTATATEKVQMDVKTILRIQGCLTFRVPVNRNNLIYEVRPKNSNSTKTLDEIAAYITSTHRHNSGIVYCLSKRDTEQVSEELCKRGIRAASYHAYMDPNVRERNHTNWCNNKIQVIVATIAFGMGINKNDCRFVIHHTVSKSLENYYQESGRAGRDGAPANCILYYRAGDMAKLSSMVFTESSGLTKLYEMVTYCENMSECRRALISNHFGDQLAEPCNKTCDNCQLLSKPVSTNVTASAKIICNIVKDVLSNDKRVTVAQLVDLWKSAAGRAKMGVIETQVAPTNFTKVDCERVIVRLIIVGVLEENFAHTAYSTNAYVRTGGKARMLDNGLFSIEMALPALTKAAKSSTTSKRKLPKESPESAEEFVDTERPKRKGRPSVVLTDSDSNGDFE